VAAELAVAAWMGNARREADRATAKSNDAGQLPSLLRLVKGMLPPIHDCLMVAGAVALRPLLLGCGRTLYRSQDRLLKSNLTNGRESLRRTVSERRDRDILERTNAPPGQVPEGVLEIEPSNRLRYQEGVVGRERDVIRK
jgi:hypothetical protein